MRNINEIVVHCTATRADWWETRTINQKVAEVRKWHVEGNGWSDIGYHFLIDRDGKVAKGRDVSVTGAHVRGRNANTIGISLFGGHGGATTDKFEDNFTPEQDAALRQLISELRVQFPTITKISGHHEYANKACPCFDVTEWYTGAPAGRTSPAQSKTVQASVAQIGTAVAGGATAVAALDGQAQIVALVVMGAIALLAAWIMRERLKKWSKGVR